MGQVKPLLPLTGTQCLLGIVIFLVWSPAPSHQNHYCSISKDHTLCKYQGIGPRCKTPYEIGVPAADRQQILHLHNYLRQMVANGGERRGRPGPQPTAANMRQMEWDDELAASAQRLADQCKYAHDCLNCRKVDRFFTGQNLYQFSENLMRDGADWEKAIMAWYDEVARFNPRSVDYFEFIKELGHYTQMAWAETYKMGCGYTYYKDGKWNRKLYICNYGPAGNVITTKMYERGAPCSACPEGTFCSQQYPGLCSSGGGGNYFPQISFAPKPKPTTQRTTTTTTRRTTTTTTTRRPTTTSRSKIVFNNEISNEIDHFQNHRKTSNKVFNNNNNRNNFGTSNRFHSGTSFHRQQPQQQQIEEDDEISIRTFPSSSHRNRFTSSNTGFTFSKPIQTTRPATTTTTTTTTTTRRPPTTTSRRPFTFSPRITTSSQLSNNRRVTNQNAFGNSFLGQNNKKIVHNQITDNRISHFASDTIQIPQTQKNSFTSSNNRFSSKPSRFSSSGHNAQNGKHSSVLGLPQAQTEVLRISDSPAYTVQDTNSIVLFCDFDYAKCPVRSMGDVGWNYTTFNTPGGFLKGFASVIGPYQSSKLEIRSIMDSSADGNVCLYFRFVNFIFGADGGRARGFGQNKFSVSVSSVKQQKKTVEISDKSSNALDWLTAKVQFSGLHSMFLLTFEVPKNTLSDNVYLAIDDVLITKGLCHV